MTTLTLSAPSQVFEKVAQVWTGIKNGYQLHREYQRTVSELRTLSNREIADLGEGHLSAEQLAFNAVYGEMRK